MEVKLVRPKDGKPSKKIIAAKFEHGQLKKGMFKKLHYNYREMAEKDSQSREDTQKILTIPAKNKLSYVGHSNSETDHSASKYYCGCLDTRTGKMTIHDLELFHMKPTFEDSEKEELVFENSLSFVQQNDRLNAAFGSLKKKRAVKARQKFKELTDETINTSVDNAIGHAVTQSDVVDSPAINPLSSESILPPFDRDADCPEHVYTAEAVITPQILTALKSPAEKFFTRTQAQLAEWTDTSEYPWYILEQLKIMPSDERRRWQKAKCLVYLHYLLTLYKYKPIQLKKRYCLPTGWPPAVREQLLSQFTTMSVGNKVQKPTRFFPSRLKDKLLLHILAVSLIIEDAKADPSLLVQDLAVAERRVSQFYRALGCSVASQKRRTEGDNLVVLKLPLKLPLESKPLTRRGGKKRNLKL
ncbi:DNA-directed RNA polymerase I subunit RPA49-like [Haliotis rubra]|uniref:DNA-directed RNA polymerase I subunit RPA49-like n=1 Tax=Haliotis rubra TaxID=36100 RepID=UPI001EE595EC|nr:DNA-directed RNA polymerase I subunit RPA49-like [Haliotis rubra]